MGAVARLIVDPAGAALARTLSYPVQRDWPERERRAVRQDERPPAADGAGPCPARTSHGRLGSCA